MSGANFGYFFFFFFLAFLFSRLPYFFKFCIVEFCKFLCFFFKIFFRVSFWFIKHLLKKSMKHPADAWPRFLSAQFHELCSINFEHTDSNRRTSRFFYH